MVKINLKNLYYFVKNDILIEVNQDIADEFEMFRRKEHAYREGVRRNKAYYSLDCNDGITQEKYLTITAFKNSIEETRMFFKRTTLGIQTYFKKLGSECYELTLEERLKILQDFYRNGQVDNFRFDFDDLNYKGYYFKNVICPEASEFKHNYFKFGDKYGRVLFLRDYARYIKDNFISELCSLNKSLLYSMDSVTVPTD